MALAKQCSGFQSDLILAPLEKSSVNHYSKTKNEREKNVKAEKNLTQCGKGKYSLYQKGENFL